MEKEINKIDWHNVIEHSEDVFLNRNYEELFYKGYGWKEEEPVWHDLRKNPYDLPSDDREVLCYVKGERCNGYRVDYYIEDMDLKWAHLYDVLAWREIPKFEEK